MIPTPGVEPGQKPAILAVRPRGTDIIKMVQLHSKMPDTVEN